MPLGKYEIPHDSSNTSNISMKITTAIDISKLFVGKGSFPAKRDPYRDNRFRQGDQT